VPLEPPHLDTHTFDQLVDLARRRIPRYTPEWTDFNASDPGATLIDLFAWLTELMLYRMNRLPELNYIKFLQLIGLQLRPAQPAVAHLTFSAQQGAEVAPIPRGTQVAAQPSGGGQQLVFETEAGLDLVRLPLATVRVYDGAAFADVTPANRAPEVSYRPFGWVPQVGSALYLGFAQTDPPTGGRLFPRDLRLRVFLPPSAQTGRPQSCTEAAQPPAPPVRLVWEHRPSPTAGRWRRLNLLLDETAAFTREGYLLVEGPAEAYATVEAQFPEPRVWLRVRLESGAYPAGRAPEIDLLLPNTVPAVNLSTVLEEPVGTSDGRPGQRFLLRQRPVAQGSLVLCVREPEEVRRWCEVDDFLASGPGDPHYVLDATTGEIRLGDGARGRIPVAGTELVAERYRFGGGAAGNVGAGQVNALLTPVTGVEGVHNERPAVGGRDEQALADLQEQAPAQLRHRGRAVTAEDFAVLAAQAGGVARATAVALAHPDHPGVPVPGALTVAVVPDSDEVPPIPSDDLIRQVCAYLDRFRLLTTEVFVTGPAYTRIKVQAAVSAKANAAFDQVARQVGAAIDRYLAPLTSGEPPAAAEACAPSETAAAAPSARIGGRPFGLDLHPTSLFGVILDGAEVVSVESLSLTVGTTPWPDLRTPIVLPPDGLVYGAPDHDISVTSELDR
jgi:predicted phage baseplate assembly protein